MGGEFPSERVESTLRKALLRREKEYGENVRRGKVGNP